MGNGSTHRAPASGYTIDTDSETPCDQRPAPAREPEHQDNPEPRQLRKNQDLGLDIKFSSDQESQGKARGKPGESQEKASEVERQARATVLVKFARALAPSWDRCRQCREASGEVGRC